MSDRLPIWLDLILQKSELTHVSDPQEYGIPIFEYILPNIIFPDLYLSESIEISIQLRIDLQEYSLMLWHKEYALDLDGTARARICRRWKPLSDTYADFWNELRHLSTLALQVWKPEEVKSKSQMQTFLSSL